MILHPGKKTYPLPPWWSRSQRCLLRTGRAVDVTLIPLVGPIEMNGALPSFYTVDENLRTVTFYPAPKQHYEVEFE